MKITNDFYYNLIGFAVNILKRHDVISHVDKMDIAHDVLCDKKLSETTWKSLVVSYVFRYKYTHFLYPLDGIPQSKDWIEHRYCKCCDSVLPEDYFISGYNAITHEWQYRAICKYCFNVSDQKKEQSRRYYLKNRYKIIERMKRYRRENPDNTSRERYERWKMNNAKNMTAA